MFYDQSVLLAEIIKGIKDPKMKEWMKGIDHAMWMATGDINTIEEKIHQIDKLDRCKYCGGVINCHCFLLKDGYVNTHSKLSEMRVYIEAGEAVVICEHCAEAINKNGLLKNKIIEELTKK